MLPSSPSNSVLNRYTAQQYESDVDRDPSASSSASTPVSPAVSIATTHQLTYPYHLHTQTSNHYQSTSNNTSSGSAPYLSPLSAHHPAVPQVRSPLAMGFSTHGNISAVAFNTRSTYNNRLRNRRNSFQQSPVAFSPTLTHNSPSGASQVGLHAPANNIHPHQSRSSYLWPGAASSSVATGGNRNRCLSTGSIDSNASSVGLSHLTPALAAMSVQHRQISPASSPYQSYSNSPQQSGLQNHYQQQQMSSSESAYPYHSPFSSPMPTSQVPASASLNLTTANIATNICGSMPPIQSTSDFMYHSSSYGSTPPIQSYSGVARYAANSVLPLGPSLYSEQDSNKMTQAQFESSMTLPTTETGGVHAFAYEDQYQPAHGQYYSQQSQQGLGILVSGGMARDMSSTPEDDSANEGRQQDQQDQQDQHQQSGMKRSTSVSGAPQNADDIHAVIGKDGKTLVYICPKCDLSKEFTTKSNLKRHLENKNIHNTPYERRRDQKRWQGHEKKQVSRDETTLRMRKWRNCNPEKNRFNDMRCRVYRNARKIYGDAYSEAKEEYIRSEIERRKQNMIIRNSRRTEWAGQPASSSGSTADPSTSTSPSASPVSSTTLGGVGFQMPESAFMFTSSYGTNSSLAASQQIPAYGATDVLLKAQDSSKPEKQKPDESKFLQDLKENRLPPRRRSRSAMHSTMNNSSSQAIDASRSTTSGVPTDTASSLAFEARGYDTFGPWASYADNITDSFDYTSSGSQQPAFRRVQKQRSATDNPEFGSTGAFGSFTDVMGEGSYQGSYMDSSQQLQMLEHKYNSSSLGQSLFFNKNDVQKQSQQQHDQESLDSVVEAMEISQAVVGTTTSVGGLYGDRDASAWLTPSATYNAHNLADPVQSEHESRGFPFPVIRDRKELARAAGIRLEIPNQHQLKAHHWINAISDTGSGANGDDMVGGSATSQESSGLSHQGHSPSESSPLSAALLSPLRGARYSTQSDDNSNRNRDVNAENEEDSGDAERSNSQYSSHVANTVGIAKTKGSNLDIFSMHSVPMPLYSQSLGSSESGFFTTDASSLGETNYFANYQGVARRHSTAMANLSSL